MKEFDAFICHASEDKEVIARPISSALKQLGFRVWFDEFELKIGDSLRKSIDRGLAASNYGVVILSPPFFLKGWANYEYDGLVQANNRQPGIILPVWHGVDAEAVEKASLPLSAIFAEKFPEKSLEDIVHSIAHRIGHARIIRERNKFKIDESKSVPVDSTDIEKGFTTISTIQSDRILNKEDTILGMEKLIMPIRDHSGHYDFFHWKSADGEIDVFRRSVYDHQLNSMVDSDFEIVEQSGHELKAKIKFEMRKNRMYEIITRTQSRNYYEDLFKEGRSKSEFLFVSGMRRFEYNFEFPRESSKDSISIAIARGPQGKVSRSGEKFRYVANNVPSGEKLEFLISK